MRPILFILLIGLLTQCGLEQDVSVKLPAHESQLVVECYLEPGSRAMLLLTESSGYFDPPKLPFVHDAIVIIRYKETIDTLNLNVSETRSNYKYYNFISNKAIPFNYENEFHLEIMDNQGRKITGKTVLTRPPKIDSVEVNYSDSSASLVAYFNQSLDEKDYYRAVFHKDSVTNIIQTIVFSDEFSSTEKTAIGTGFRYKKGDKGFVTLYKLDKEYYDFLQSMEAARDANGNPFAQPSMIKSNVNGGIGIFTGSSYDFEFVSIE